MDLGRTESALEDLCTGLRTSKGSCRAAGEVGLEPFGRSTTMPDDSAPDSSERSLVGWFRLGIGRGEAGTEPDVEADDFRVELPAGTSGTFSFATRLAGRRLTLTLTSTQSKLARGFARARDTASSNETSIGLSSVPTSMTLVLPFWFPFFSFPPNLLFFGALDCSATASSAGLSSSTRSVGGTRTRLGTCGFSVPSLASWVEVNACGPLADTNSDVPPVTTLRFDGAGAGAGADDDGRASSAFPTPAFPFPFPLPLPLPVEVPREADALLDLDLPRSLDATDGAGRRRMGSGESSTSVGAHW